MHPSADILAASGGKSADLSSLCKGSYGPDSKHAPDSVRAYRGMGAGVTATLPPMTEPQVAAVAMLAAQLDTRQQTGAGWVNAPTRS
jgi:hypothetical protein